MTDISRDLFITDAAPPMSNVMLDLETWGTTPGSAIRSIGAVEFDPFSEKLGEEFYANITDESCAEIGLLKDQSTIDWWAKQSKQAQDSLAVDQRHIKLVANDFHDWWRKRRATFVWSQGANFDEPLWGAVCRALGLRTPWKFWDSRCTRTAYELCQFNPFAVKRAGTYHNALDDAKHQARCVQAAYKNLLGRKK